MGDVQRPFTPRMPNSILSVVGKKSWFCLKLFLRESPTVSPWSSEPLAPMWAEEPGPLDLLLAGKKAEGMGTRQSLDSQ